MGNSDDNRRSLGEEAQMSQMVKCDVCGRSYNQRYLTSHKRLSHKKKSSAATSVDEAKAVDMILALFMQISAEAKKDVLDRLNGLSESH